MSLPSGASHDPATPGAAAPASGRSLMSRIRYWIPVAIVVICGAVESILWIQRSGDATRQVISAYIMLPLTTFLLLGWWLFHSGVAWKLRIGVVALLLAAAGGFFSFVRVKDFTGDMVPEFEYRWQLSAEQKAAEYFKNLEQKPVADDHASQSGNEFPISPGDWPQFEGPHRDGIAHGVRIEADWSRQPPRKLWRHPIGAGWSSFAVVGNYCFTQEQRGDDEAVVCYDASGGKQLWAHLDPKVRSASVLGGVGPRATPTVAGSRVYAFGSTGILNCLDPKQGAVIWSKNTMGDAGPDVQVLQFGMSGSPLVYDDLVVVNPGGVRKNIKDTRESGAAVIAYNRTTGQKVWAAGSYQAGYASPILATIDGVRQVIIYDAVGAGGYDAATGKELWRSLEWKNSTDNNIAQPIVQADGSIFLSSGYGTGCMLFKPKKSGDQWSVSERWTAPNKFKLKFNPGVLRDGCVYGLDEGILACFDLSNGQERWKRGRYKYGQVLLLDDSLFVISEDGDAVLVEISPSASREITRFHAIDGTTWNLPVICHNRLYVRNGEEAACYDLSSQQTAARIVPAAAGAMR